MLYFNIKTPFKETHLLRAALVTVALVLFGKFAIGQTVLKYVPFNADIVVSVNLQNLDKKVNWEQLKQYDFFQAAIKDMLSGPEFEENQGYKDFTERFLTDPTSIGFDTKEPLVFFIEKKGYDTYMTFVSKMGNKAAYESAIQKIKSSNIKPCDEAPAGMNIWQRGGSFFAWNDEVIIEVKKEAGYDPGMSDWSYTDTLSYEDVYEDWDTTTIESPGNEEMPSDEVLHVLDSLGLPHPGQTDTISLEEFDAGYDWAEPVDTAAINWMVKVLNRDFLQPLTRNYRFMSAKGRSNDVHFWMDYFYFMEIFARSNRPNC